MWNGFFCTFKWLTLFILFMKNNYLLGIVLLFSIQLSFSQFIDDMEWSAGNCPSHWGGGNPSDCPIVVTSNAYDGLQSGYIPGDGVTDNILDLGNKIFGQWGLEFYMFIPTGKEAYFNLQGEVPVGSGEWIVGNFFFNQDSANPGVGFIDDTALGVVTFNFPHDQWFRVVMSFDITKGIEASTWYMCVDSAVVIPKWTPFTNNAGTYPTSLGGVDFFSISSDNELYIDTFAFHDDFIPCIIINSTRDYSSVQFSIVPNPAYATINIKSTDEISQITIFSQTGQKVISEKIADEIDVSHLASGLYFIEVVTQAGKGIQKFVKY